jgi:hypothetical protein
MQMMSMGIYLQLLSIQDHLDHTALHNVFSETSAVVTQLHQVVIHLVVEHPVDHAAIHVAHLVDLVVTHVVHHVGPVAIHAVMTIATA